MLGAGAIVEKKFIKDTQNAIEINEKLLLDILDKNSKSELGEKYRFNEIKSSQQYKNIFPLTEYEYYEKYIERMAKGEENILTTSNIEYFSHTSGTTGKQKLIPTTKESKQAATKYMAILMNKFAYNEFKGKWNYGKVLMLADIVMSNYTDTGIPICSATSGGLKGIKNFIPYLYTSPIEVMEIEDKESALYLHLLFALSENKLFNISGVFISNVLDLFRILERDNKLLIRDIKRGTINKSIKLNEKTRIKLQKLLSPNVGRAEKLQNEFENGFKGIARRIWPKLAYISTVTGANFSIYDDLLNYYTDNIPIYSPVYSASEATIGINPFVKEIKYVVIPDTVYYEFIPISKSGEKAPKTLTLNEVVEGEDYEVVVTNYAGLYRYRLGDVVRVIEFYENSPVIEFLYRKNQLLNMVSEKTNEDHITQAIKNSMEKLRLNLVDYTTDANNNITPGNYVFYIELVESFNQKYITNIENVLDEELRKCNLAYDRARKSKKLGKLQVYLLKPNTFSMIKEKSFIKGVSKNQIKIPRVITNKKNIKDIIEKQIYI